MWCIIKVTEDDYRLLRTESGSYLNEDWWHINSGIEKVEETDNTFIFKGHSGSVYEVDKLNYGIHPRWSYKFLWLPVLLESEALRYVKEKMT